MCILNFKTQQPTVSPLHRTEKCENSIKSKIYAHTGFSFLGMVEEVCGNNFN